MKRRFKKWEYRRLHPVNTLSEVIGNAANIGKI